MEVDCCSSLLDIDCAFKDFAEVFLELDLLFSVKSFHFLEQAFRNDSVVIPLYYISILAVLCFQAFSA